MFNSTKITISFQTDNDVALLNIIFVLWFIQNIAQRANYEMSMIVRDFSDALGFVGKIVCIGCNSLVWGIVGI